MSNAKMFTIDLLKGRGVPVRSSPKNIAVIATSLAVPAIIAVMMFVYYMHSNIVISIQNKEITNCEAMTNKLSEATALLKTFESEKKYVSASLSEVAATINKHTQWTPVIVEIVKNMPDSIVLTEMNVREETIQKRVASRGKPGGMVDISVPVRTMQINVCESSGFVYGQSIRDFEDRLRSSPLLGPRLDNINVSQDADKVKGQDVTSYQIDCAFKPTL
jgi:hypothetical protein